MVLNFTPVISVPVLSAPLPAKAGNDSTHTLTSNARDNTSVKILAIFFFMNNPPIQFCLYV